MREDSRRARPRVRTADRRVHRAGRRRASARAPGSCREASGSSANLRGPAAAAGAARRRGSSAGRKTGRVPAQGAGRCRSEGCSATSHRRVLGQYDVFLPPDDEGLLYFVGPNMAEAERRFALPPRDFRLWVAVHEVCHRVQFGAAPWLSRPSRDDGRALPRHGVVGLGRALRAAPRAVEEARAGARCARHRRRSSCC